MAEHSFGTAHESDDEYAARHEQTVEIDRSYEEMRRESDAMIECRDGYIRDREAERKPLSEHNIQTSDALLDALKPFAAFAEALNEAVPDEIAIGIYADGAMRFGPSGGATVGDLRKARVALAKAGAA